MYNYAGDYSGDFKINYSDLLSFASAWNASPQDLTKEIGPASGTPPLLIPSPDGIIDFEDLMVLVQQWNWSWNNPEGLAKTRPPLSLNKSVLDANQFVIQDNKNEGAEYHLKLNGPAQGIQRPAVLFGNSPISFEQSGYDPWNGSFGSELALNFDSSAAVLGFSFDIKFDPEVISVKNISNRLLEERAGFSFINTDKAGGRTVYHTVVLDPKKINEQASGCFFVINLDVYKEAETHLEISYKVNDIMGAELSSGMQEIGFFARRTVPDKFTLFQNFPNPFNPNTTIRYQLPVDGRVKLDVYNILGQNVTSLVNKKQHAGYYSLQWNILEKGSQPASGLYILQLRVKGSNGELYLKNIKAVLMK